MNTEYDRFEHTENQQPSTSNLPALRPVKKQHPGARIAALALSAVLLCGGSAYGGCALYGAMHPAAPAAEVQVPETTPEANFLSNFTQPEADTAAGTLYQAQLPSCVGITVSTPVNIFDDQFLRLLRVWLHPHRRRLHRHQLPCD